MQCVPGSCCNIRWHPMNITKMISFPLQRCIKYTSRRQWFMICGMFRKVPKNKPLTTGTYVCIILNHNYETIRPSHLVSPCTYVSPYGNWTPLWPFHMGLAGTDGTHHHAWRHAHNADSTTSMTSPPNYYHMMKYETCRKKAICNSTPVDNTGSFNQISGLPFFPALIQLVRISLELDMWLSRDNSIKLQPRWPALRTYVRVSVLIWEVGLSDTCCLPALPHLARTTRTSHEPQLVYTYVCMYVHV